VPDVAFLTERMRLGFGVDLLIDQVAAGLSRLGNTVTVYASFEDGTYADRPYRLRSFGVPASRWAPVYDVRALTLARAGQLTSAHHDVWFAATPPFFALLPFLEGRGVAIDCGVSDWCGQPWWAQASARFSQWAQHHAYFRRAAGITTISHWLRDQLPVDLQNRADPILLGADHYPLAPPDEGRAARDRLGVADGEVLALYVGRLNPHHQPYKGTAELLDVVGRARQAVPGLKLAMVGFGTDDDARRVRARGGLPVVNAPVGEMGALLAAADLYVTASRWEGFDLPLVEAQRAGLPVVAYRRGAHTEVVDDGTSGRLVDTVEELEDALIDLASDADLRAEQGRAAASWAARFRWEDTASGYDELARRITRDAA